VRFSFSAQRRPTTEVRVLAVGFAWLAAPGSLVNLHVTAQRAFIVGHQLLADLFITR
jgi:hypothetical protein